MTGTAVSPVAVPPVAVPMPRIVVAGVASGVGKTTVATGLMAALAARGRRVAAAKVGPDYIDPSYHRLATGRPSRNLDAFLCGPDLVAPLFAHGVGAGGAAGADVAVVEGVMGLFDGASPQAAAAADHPDPGGRRGANVPLPDPGRLGFASTAHVAALLDAPVVLVVDAGGMAASIAALVHGYATFDPRVRLSGVIANRVGSARHADLLREALAPLGIPLLGALRRDVDLVTPSRHLGLVPVAERPAEARAAVAALGARVAAAVDLDAVEAVAATALPLRAAPWAPASPAAPGGRPVRVAVAGGAAFSFAYPEHAEALAAAGAEVVGVDPAADEVLPAGTDAVVLGGGFPEAHAAALAANTRLRAEIAALAAAGAPIVAECGGLCYLARDLDGVPMAGVLDATATMTDRLVLGYRRAVAATDSVLFRAGEVVRAHEFHCSAVTPPAAATPAWHVDGRAEGFVAAGGPRSSGPRSGGRRSVHASYLHVHWAATPAVPGRLVAAASSARREAA